MKSTKKSLLLSTISLVLCFAMLLGTTYAWFTDEVTSGVNQIKAGNLDVELFHAIGAVSESSDKVTADTKLFNIEHWEPGVVAYENFMVKNVGNLALDYQLSIIVGDKNATTDGHSLDEVLKVAIVPDEAFDGDRTAAQTLSYTALKDFSATNKGALRPNSEGDTFGVVIYWEPTENDNLYNLNNGKTATVVADKFGEDALGIELGIKLTATQRPLERDSFDHLYDFNNAGNAVVATWSGESTEVTIPESGSEPVTMQVEVENEVKVKATVEAGTKVKTATDDVAKELTTGETIKLTIEPDATPTGITVETAQSVTTYDVSLIKVVTTTEEGGGETKTTTEIVEADKPVLVSLDIGVVDLVDFYHHGTKLNKVSSKDAITDEGMYWYDQENGTVYFKTKSFSPFASVYKFAGGLGTEDHPYLLGTEEHFLSLKEGFTTETENVYFKFLNDMDMSKASIQSKKGQTWSRNRWFDAMYDSTVIHLEMNGKTIDNLDCFLFAGIQNLEMKNGTINFIDGQNEPGIIYFVSCGIEDGMEYHRNLTFKNLTLNGQYEANMSHYGPVIAQSYGGSFESDTVLLENVVSNVNINNVAGGAYTGGLLGYVYGPITIKNCAFNGMIQSPLAGGFINPMSVGSVINEGNAFNGKLLATNTVQKFGHGSDIVASEGEGASASKVTVSTNLISNSNIGEEIKINHTDENIKRYAVSIMVWTNEATCTTVFDVNVPASTIGTIATGLYKNYFENSTTDGSTAQTKVNSGWYDGCIWRDGDTYKVYCSSSTQVKTSSDATIYVYGYNEAGNIVTYQTQRYSPAKPAN